MNEEYKILVEVASSRSGLELHCAALMGQLEDVKFLVEEQHCNPMERDESGCTALYVAATAGNISVFK